MPLLLFFLLFLSSLPTSFNSSLLLLLPYSDVLHIDSRAARGHKFAFQVLATGSKFHFATKTAAEREHWITHLNDLLFGPPLPDIVCEYKVYMWSQSMYV